MAVKLQLFGVSEVSQIFLVTTFWPLNLLVLEEPEGPFALLGTTRVEVNIDITSLPSQLSAKNWGNRFLSSDFGQFFVCQVSVCFFPPSQKTVYKIEPLHVG